MHDYCSRGSEPGLEGRNSWQLVTFSDLDIGSGLQQVLLHVVHEVIEQLHFLLQVGWVVSQCVVVLLAVVVDVVNVAEKYIKIYVNEVF